MIYFSGVFRVCRREFALLAIWYMKYRTVFSPDQEIVTAAIMREMDVLSLLIPNITVME